jgi:endonuclease YncB( thermonuclease family)
MRISAIAARVGVTVGLLGATFVAPFGLTHGVAASGSGHTNLGHHLVYCYGTVTKVDDGDTVNVHLTSACPGGKKGALMVVRNAGIQATETSHYGSKPDCWSGAGQQFFRSLMHHGAKVRLSSYFATPNPETDGEGRTRWIKYMDAWVGGHWVDAQAAEISAGLAMYKQEPVEDAHLSQYMRDEQAAMYNRLGIWGHPNYCSNGYSQGAQFESWIVWKANGRDNASTAHEESFNVRNIGTTSVNLSHWSVRDASHRFAGGTNTNIRSQSTYLVLPAGTVLAPGHTLVIHPTHGTSKPSKLVFYNNGHVFGHTGGPQDYFPNAVMGRGGLGAHPAASYPGGSQLFLLDPARDFRAWATYPCVYKCGMPAALTITANPGINDHNNEYVQINNPTNDSVPLTGDVVDMDGKVKNLSGELAAGATMTIHCLGTGRDTELNQYWDNLANQLPNSGGTIWLRTASDVTIDKFSWGNSGNYNYYKS